MRLMVSVCVILYDNEKFIEPFFQSLLKGINEDWEIILFDNNSNDRTVSLLETLIKNTKYSANIKLIKSKTNLGYAAGVNRCVGAAQYDDILLVNPNSITERKHLQSLLTFYQSHRTAIVAGRYVEYLHNGPKAQPSAVHSASFTACMLQLTNIGKILPFLTFANTFWEKQTGKELEVTGVSAGFTFFSKKLFSKVEGFDEGFFMYLEDLDFCMRARERGHSVYFYPRAQLQHFGGGSSMNEKNRHRKQHWRDSRNRFFKKHFSPWQYFFFKITDTLESRAGLI